MLYIKAKNVCHCGDGGDGGSGGDISVGGGIGVGIWENSIFTFSNHQPRNKEIYSSKQ